MYSISDIQKLVQMLNYLGFSGNIAPPHSVVIGGGSVAPGANGTLFASNGPSADPSFQTLASLGIQPAGTYAPLPLPANSVGSSQIANGAVGSAQLGNNVVGDVQLSWGGVLYRSADTLASLRALSKLIYSRVKTAGYAAVGDGGDGEYWLDPSAAGFTLAVPSGIVLTPSTTGGYLAAGTYSYRVAAIDESGATMASAGVTTTTTGTTGSVTIAWSAVAGSAGYLVYGRVAGSEALLVQLQAGYLSWVDDGGLTSGTSLPSGSPWQWDNGGSRIQAADGGRWKLKQKSSHYIIEQWGAKNDGSTNNAAAINSAINAAWCNGGGEILFKAGVYMSGQIVMATNVSLYGIGTDHSGHFQPPSFSANLGTTLRCIPGLNPSNGFIYLPLYVHSNRVVSINFDGNSAGNTTMATIYVAPGFPNSDFDNQSEDLYFTIQDCGITGGTNFGLYVGPAGRGGRMYNSYVYNNPGDGVRIQTSDWTLATSLWGLNANNIVFLGAAACHVTNCDIFVPNEPTIGSSGVNVLINDSTFFGGPVPSGPIWFTSCEFDYAAEHSVEIFGTNTGSIFFDNCCFNSASINHNNTYSVFAIGPNVANGEIVVANCQFSTGAPPNVAQYIFNFADPVNTWIRASNNVIQPGSYVTGITNSFGGLRLSTGLNDATYLDGAGRMHATQYRANSENNALQSQLSNPTSTENSYVLEVLGGLNTTASFRTVNNGGFNASATGLYMGSNSTTGRSINAGGTINASGADYAEYEFKRDDCGVVSKGQIIGFDVDGLLTDKFDLAIRFGIKSTAPNIVGGDSWDISQREKVDRIAYCGKVPLNVEGAKPGQYVLPAAANDGGIDISLIDPSSITFDQYRMAVGKVGRLLPDGRAEVVIKIT